MLASGHQQHVPRRVIGPIARLALRHHRTNDPSEKIAARAHSASAGEHLRFAIVIHGQWHSNRNVTDHTDPTVLWRMKRGSNVAHATLIPGTPTTIAWFFDGTMDRAENYDSEGLALARADHIRGVLERDGWELV